MNKRMDQRSDNMNRRFESIENHLSSLTSLMAAMFGSIMALIIALAGYEEHQAVIRNPTSI